MADLDDFFAKKDRKKAKTKKFTTMEEIAKKMEETGKKTEQKPKKEKMNMLSGTFGSEGDDLTGNNEEDEEWKEFKEEKKDYSGLKIQNLNLQDYDDSDDNEGDFDGESEDNDAQDSNSRKKGPWKVVDNADNPPQPAAAAAAATSAPEKKAETPPPTRKSYVPPALRNQANREKISRPPGKPEAPDITNKEFFPTLSAATSEPSASWRRKQDAGFEEVRNSRSHSSRADPNRTPQGLRIGNKFGALESENS